MRAAKKPLAVKPTIQGRRPATPETRPHVVPRNIENHGILITRPAHRSFFAGREITVEYTLTQEPPAEGNVVFYIRDMLDYEHEIGRFPIPARGTTQNFTTSLPDDMPFDQFYYVHAIVGDIWGKSDNFTVVGMERFLGAVTGHGISLNVNPRYLEYNPIDPITLFITNHDDDAAPEAVYLCHHYQGGGIPEDAPLIWQSGFSENSQFDREHRRYAIMIALGASRIEDYGDRAWDLRIRMDNGRILRSHYFFVNTNLSLEDQRRPAVNWEIRISNPPNTVFGEETSLAWRLTGNVPEERPFFLISLESHDGTVISLPADQAVWHEATQSYSLAWRPPVSLVSLLFVADPEDREDRGQRSRWRIRIEAFLPGESSPTVYSVSREFDITAGIDLRGDFTTKAIGSLLDIRLSGDANVLADGLDISLVNLDGSEQIPIAVNFSGRVIHWPVGSNLESNGRYDFEENTLSSLLPSADTGRQFRIRVMRHNYPYVAILSPVFTIEPPRVHLSVGGLEWFGHLRRGRRVSCTGNMDDHEVFYLYLVNNNGGRRILVGRGLHANGSREVVLNRNRNQFYSTERPRRGDFHAHFELFPSRRALSHRYIFRSSDFTIPRRYCVRVSGEIE